MGWHAAFLQRLSAPLDEEDLVLSHLGECFVNAAEAGRSSDVWANRMQELYELKPSDNLRMLMAFSCRKQADFDRFFSTFTELERSDVTAIARALSFCSAEIADYVVGKVRQQGVDVDSNLTLQAVLSLLAAKNGALEDASRHVSAAIERLQVTSPGPMGLFVISQLVQSLCRQGHVETAMQLVEQHVGLNDENTSSHGPHRCVFVVYWFGIQTRIHSVWLFCDNLARVPASL